MNLTNIETAIFSWAAAAINNPAVTIIWDEPDKPRPKSPSVRLSFLQGPTGMGIDERRPDQSETPDPDVFRIVGPRTMVLSIIAYGDASFQIMSDMQTAVSDCDIAAILYAAGVSILSTSSMRDATAPLETKYEKRAQMDFTLLAMEDKASSPGYIESAAVAGDIALTDPEETLNLDMTITADDGGV